MNYHVDALTGEYVGGWAFSPEEKLSVRILVDGRHVADAVWGILRPDVQSAYPQFPASLHSGFRYTFQANDFSHCKGRAANISVLLVVGNRPPITVASGHVALFAATPTQMEIDTLTGELLRTGPAPFPAGVMALILSLRGEAEPPKSWNDEEIDAAIKDLVMIARSGLRTSSPISAYFGYITQLWAKLSFIERWFPLVNVNRPPEANDGFCVGSSATEMFAIAHYLYVIRSYGIGGDLAEFGCYKGFSTACLSYACHELQMEMHVFDSFAGLPQSTSTWYSAGEFAASLEEVRENLAAFGNLSVVDFHKGFFANSLKEASPPSIACLWMDVDLAISATDVMSVMPKLSKHGCVFSHECAASNFANGEIDSPVGPEQVIPSIKAGFTAAGRPIVGRYIGGFTGAFWDKHAGVPPLAARHLSKIRDIAIGRDYQSDETEKQLREAQEQVVRLQNEISGISTRLALSESTLDTVLGSRSWRATAPLRKLMKSVRNWRPIWK